MNYLKLTKKLKINCPYKLPKDVTELYLVNWLGENKYFIFLKTNIIVDKMGFTPMQYLGNYDSQCRSGYIITRDKKIGYPSNNNYMFENFSKCLEVARKFCTKIVFTKNGQIVSQNEMI